MKTIFFPDTIEGAKEYLHQDTDLPHEVIDSAKFEADPYVNGCWRATLKNYHCKYAIIYGLGGTDRSAYDSELGD